MRSIRRNAFAGSRTPSGHHPRGSRSSDVFGRCVVAIKQLHFKSHFQRICNNRPHHNSNHKTAAVLHSSGNRLASTVGVIQAPLLFFSKDVSSVPFNYQLLDPNEQLHTTRQLAYSLALLQASVHVDGLSSDALKWRYSVLHNSE